MATKKTVAVRKTPEVVAAQLVEDILQREAAKEDLEYDLKLKKEKLKKVLHVLPYHRLVLQDGWGYKLMPYKNTQVKEGNEMAAKAWGLESPETRMNVSTAAITKAFEGKSMPKWATRIHAEKLMPVKPALK